jgi:hypothetical protein
MPLGPGVYDEHASRVRAETDATAVILIVIGGERGSGFTMQAPPAMTEALPSILRSMADSIEADLA